MRELTTPTAVTGGVADSAVAVGAGLEAAGAAVAAAVGWVAYRGAAATAAGGARRVARLGAAAILGVIPPAVFAAAVAGREVAA